MSGDCSWLLTRPREDGNDFTTKIVVPTLYEGPFDLEKIKALANGKSVIDGKTTREGVVVKPIKERHVRGLGRLVLKVISNKYLEQN